MAFLFGVVGSERVPGAALTRLLGDLGMAASASRTLLSRMRRQGQLTTIRHGRTVDYQLAGAFAEGFRRVRQVDTDQTREWTGAFQALLYQVPESERAYRDAFRRVALNAGYGLLQPGVLIALDDRRSALSDLLEAAPAAARIRPARLSMEPADAAAAADHAWELAELTSTLRGHVHMLREALRRTEPPGPDPESLRQFVELSETPLADLARAPNLPPELAPRDWPLDDLRTAVSELHQLYGPPTRAYANQLIAGA
ncbi:hypothetical protein GCM10027569_39110 [Flindersiella endophytica]